MKEVLQSLLNGKTEVVEVPAPHVREGHLLIASRKSLLSAGTERMLIEFGKSSWLGKARQQPEEVRRSIQKIKTDGLLETLSAISSRLDRPIPLGYSSVGIVIDVGGRAPGFKVGDRVISNGPHAEIVAVPHLLCAQVPEMVSDDDAVYAVVSAIGLQGIRLAAPGVGEVFAVIGLGLVGLLTCMLLRAQGCTAIGLDPREERRARAIGLGFQSIDPTDSTAIDRLIFSTTRGRGVDGALVTAATRSNDPVHQAAQMSRQRGRIVLVGVTGLKLDRADFYEKELSFQVSCSYGPGRYDVEYEGRGHDYPVGFVRWTAQRNFEAVLDQMAADTFHPACLTTDRMDIDRAEEAYRLLLDGGDHLGIVLEYGTSCGRKAEERAVWFRQPHVPSSEVCRGTTFVGAGDHALKVLIPSFRKAGACFRRVVSLGGVSASHAGRKFGFEIASTDVEKAIVDPEVKNIVIATPQESHAGLVARSLEAGKNVFVEKPLATKRGELESLEATIRDLDARVALPVFTVGFNRRFSKHSVRLRQEIMGRQEPASFIYTVNAGPLSQSRRVHDQAVGKARLLGEVCHFIDLLRFLVGRRIVSFTAAPLGTQAADSAIVTLRFEDDSIGSINYFSNGHRSFPKERLEVFCEHNIYQIDNFRKLRLYGVFVGSLVTTFRQDKGHRRCVEAFLRATEGKSNLPIPLDEIFEVTRTSIDVVAALSCASLSGALA